MYYSLTGPFIPDDTSVKVGRQRTRDGARRSNRKKRGAAERLMQDRAAKGGEDEDDESEDAAVAMDATPLCVPTASPAPMATYHSDTRVPSARQYHTRSHPMHTLPPFTPHTAHSVTPRTAHPSLLPTSLPSSPTSSPALLDRTG
jgi:hypothetical protein